MGYPRQVYQRASEELGRRREVARQLGQARAAEIAKMLPEITDIQREMATTAISVTKLVAAASGDMSHQIKMLRDKNLDLQRRRAEILIAAGYPGDYLSEQKACDKCGGSGYIGSDMCVCFRELLKKEAYSELSAVSQVKNCTFKNFSTEYYPLEATAGDTPPRKHMKGVLDACKAYADNFSADSPSLLMFGCTGLGKTHLSLAIACEVTEKGFGVVYVPVQKLMDKLEAQKFSYSPEAKEQYSRDLENVLECDLLVLDDLGAEFATNFSVSTLYNIVNTRLVESRPTIISTNFEFSEIEAKYSQRMLSRLTGGYSVKKFLGKDIRLIKKSANKRPSY